jgi:hypothetical protein
MNNHEKEMIARLEAMPLNEARREIASGGTAFGNIGSPDHAFCSSWLGAKEATSNDKRTEETLLIARWGIAIAIAALVLSVISIGVALFK